MVMFKITQLIASIYKRLVYSCILLDNKYIQVQLLADFKLHHMAYQQSHVYA